MFMICEYFTILIINIILGAPRLSRGPEAPETSTALLTRLRRALAPEDMSESLSNVLDSPKEPHKQEHEAFQLENLLEEEENFESRPNGGSFSPVRNNENEKKISSLPE
jgi:hypothetical protein